MALPDKLTDDDLAQLTTADRLRLVADIIEDNPRRWEQSEWFRTETHTEYGRIRTTAPSLFAYAGTGSEHWCDSVGCFAGWAATTVPKEDLVYDIDGCPSESVDDLAARAFGFDESLHAVFASGAFDLADRDHEDAVRAVAGVLRALAELPEPRTLDAAIEAGIVVTDYWGHVQVPEHLERSREALDRLES